MTKRHPHRWNFRRFQKSSQAFFRLLLRCLPFVVVFGFAYFIFLNARNMVHADSYFKVEKVTVFPSGILSGPELNFLEAEARRQSLLKIDLKEISRSLERNPKVKRAEVNRNLPNELNILLLTRMPLVQVQLEVGGKFFIVADDQIVLSISDSPRPNLMILEDFSSQKHPLSTGSFYPNPHFRSLFGFFEALKNDPILGRETISKMSIDQIGNITLLLSDGIELKMGKEVPSSDGVRAVLSSFLRSNQQRSQLLYLDLRYRDIIVKRKTEL